MDESSIEGLCPACLFADVLEKNDNFGVSGGGSSGLPPGTHLGPFRIERVLGQGGMAKVYEAYEFELNRSVALKVLPREFLHVETFVERFIQEAKNTANLEHRNIVPVYARGIDDGLPWMSMRLFPGGTLSGLITENPEGLGAERTTKILHGIAEALDHAHSRNLMHRDIKPSNILLDREGRAYVSDFGLSRLMEGAERLTHSGNIVGTPHYMAPEQAGGGPVDHRCDIYSLGVVAYEMLTGRTPFRGSDLGILEQHKNDPVPVPPRNLVSDSQFDVLKKALAKKPAARWQTAVEFVTQLESASETTAVVNRVWVITGLAAAVLLLWSAVYTIPRSQPDQPGPTVSGTATLPPQSPGPQPSPPPEETKTDLKKPEAPPPGPPIRRVEKQPPDKPHAEPSMTTAGPPASPPAATGGSEPPEITRVDGDAKQTETQPTSVELNVSPPVTDTSPTEPPGEVITKPELVRRVEPVYPRNALVAKIEGDVVLQAVILPDGRATEVRVLNSPNRALDSAAIRAVQQSTYKPGLRNGKPDTFTFEITVEFRLN